MRQLIRFISLSFIPIILVLIFLLFLNTLKLDYKYAHKSLVTYQQPFDWAVYKLEINFLKFIKKLKNNTDVGLNIKKIYITEKSKEILLSNVPMSTKVWQPGFFSMKNNELKKIKIRYRGDNPRNWLFEKKNLRIKTSRKDQFGQYRYYDFDPFRFQKFVSGKIANKTGVISPEYNLIELYINDNSEGIYIQTEKINENFLRRNKIMPVNIYKGEQINSEAIIKTENNLFNNSLIWKKVANFNQTNKEDKSDLIDFINLLRKSEIDMISHNKLMSMIDLNEWGKFAAYQILTDNYHNDYAHNMRLIFDPWSGKLRPIIYDPILGNNIFNKNNIDLNNSSHDLLLFLNKNSLFINEKYKELFNLLSSKKIIQKQVEELNSLEKRLLISEHRDIELQRTVYNNLSFFKKINPLQILKLSNKKERASVIKNLLDYSLQLNNKFYLEPISSWFFSDNKINLKVNGDMPISNIEFFFNKNTPKWISIDLNGDSIFDENEKFMPSDKGVISIPLTLYANRTIIAENQTDLKNPKIITSNTRFVFKVENSIQPYKIEVQNPFSQKKFNLKIDNSPSIPAHKFNLPILADNFLIENLIELEGVIKVNKDLIFKDKVKIKPGTKFLINSGINIVFLNSVNALGTKKNPIIFKKLNDNNLDYNWGSIIIQGPKTKKSKFYNMIISGGSGGQVDQFVYSSMLSLHNTEDIVLKDIILSHNKNYDDALHLVYCKNILLENITIEDAFSDALDIDISNEIYVKNSKFLRPKNDSIDLMESNVLIDSTEIYDSGDKGISIGENSNAIIHNTYLNNNKIGIAIKDNSVGEVLYTDFKDNITHIGSYQKNYKYGNGGKISVIKSNFDSKENKVESDSKSNIVIKDSTFNKKFNSINPNIDIFQKINFDGNRSTEDNLDLSAINNMLNFVDVVKKKKLRGSDFTNN